MDGMHDLGGKQGFGPVRHSPIAPVFHAAWEKKANALYSLAVKHGVFNMDEYRHAIERMEPRHYLSASYYERSLTSLATLLVEKGLVTKDELEARVDRRGDRVADEAFLEALDRRRQEALDDQRQPEGQQHRHGRCLPADAGDDEPVHDPAQPEHQRRRDDRGQDRVKHRRAQRTVTR